MFTEQDLARFAARGIDRERVEEQVMNFRTGFPYLKIDRAAVVGDGIVRVDREKAQELAATYGRVVAEGLVVEKFVPASGAASRMFKELYEFVEGGNEAKSDAVERVLAGLERFAFYEDLVRLGVDRRDPKAVIAAIVEGDLAAGTGLGLGKRPKGLIKFHAYPSAGTEGEGTCGRTAMEEHLVEVALYGGKPARIHFTVSPEHMEDFKGRAAECVEALAAKYGVEYEISYSVQEPATDTVAVNPDNTPFRTEDGAILFRPGGHGALIENLGRIDADLIFIKTVDNVVPDHLKGDTVLYKKALGAVALELQQQIFSYLKRIDGAGAAVSAELAEEVRRFVEEKLCYRFPEGYVATVADLRRVLDRPVRVCGMVRNEGEPGGGPFFARGASGAVSLQIVESSQIEPVRRAEAMAGATHFNPVDVVCGVRDRRGRKYDLTRYVDRMTGFISEKSRDGRPLKAMERPGLWNGAMSDWNTLFVEVPAATFTPVKTVTDLLRPGHRE